MDYDLCRCGHSKALHPFYPCWTAGCSCKEFARYTFKATFADENTKQIVVVIPLAALGKLTTTQVLGLIASELDLHDTDEVYVQRDSTYEKVTVTDGLFGPQEVLPRLSLKESLIRMIRKHS